MDTPNLLKKRFKSPKMNKKPEFDPLLRENTLREIEEILNGFTEKDIIGDNNKLLYSTRSCLNRQKDVEGQILGNNPRIPSSSKGESEKILLLLLAWNVQKSSSLSVFPRDIIYLLLTTFRYISTPLLVFGNGLGSSYSDSTNSTRPENVILPPALTGSVHWNSGILFKIMFFLHLSSCIVDRNFLPLVIIALVFIIFI